MTQRKDDLTLLNELLKEHPDELTDVETEAFAGMRFDLTVYNSGMFLQLTEKQRAWAVSVRERIVPQYANLWSRGLVPKGREVSTPPVLQSLPKRPPPLPAPIFNGPPRASRKHCGCTDDGCYAFVNGDCTCGCCLKKEGGST